MMKNTNWKKTALSVIACLVLVFALLPAAAMAEETEVECTHSFTDGTCTVCGITGGYCGAEGDNLMWTLVDGKLTITGSDAMADYSFSPWYSHRETITSVSISEGVTHIGRYAFDGFTGLESITIPASVTSIATDVFDSCYALKAFTVVESNTAYKSVDGVLFTKDGKTLVKYPANKADTVYTIPDGVETIGEEAFEYAAKLTTVTIPDSVTSMDFCAFRVCENLETVDFGTGLTAIGGVAFAECTKLDNVVIPANITRIDIDAFANCSGLTKITFAGTA